MDSDRDVLERKKVLIVDDEPDILDTLEELLDMCEVEKATSFTQAKELLESRPFEIAILDIMGVDGYKLLEIAKDKKITTVMLTAHGLSVENTVKAYKNGAAYFVPKEKMFDITTYLGDIIRAQGEGKHPWKSWLKRFGSYYENRFWKKALKDKTKDF